jgi:hypothetical protein
MTQMQVGDCGRFIDSRLQAFIETGLPVFTDADCALLTNAKRHLRHLFDPLSLSAITIPLSKS